MYRCLHSSALGYLAWDLQRVSHHVGDCTLSVTQHWLFHALCILPLATAFFQHLLHLFGTVCQSQFGHRHRCKFSAADWRLNCLPDLTAVLSLMKNVSLHWLLRDFTVIVNSLHVLAVLGLNATLKETRSSSSSSSYWALQTACFTCITVSCYWCRQCIHCIYLRKAKWLH